MAEWDVAVIGGGPAGIAAAVAAAEVGRRVLLIDESPRPGGQIWRHLEGQRPPPARRWLERLARSEAEIRSGTAVVDAEGPGDGKGRAEAEPGTGPSAFRLRLEGPAGPDLVHASALVLATGARERFLPFPGWTLPGVVGVGGAQALLKSGTCFVGRRVVVAGSGPLLLPVSAALASAGARLLLVAEQAPLRQLAGFARGLWRDPLKLLQAGRYRLAGRSGPYRTDSWVLRVLGEGRVEKVDVQVNGKTSTLPCDLLCTGFGLVPNPVLARLLGCTTAGGFVRVDAQQRTSVPGVWCAGEGTGIAGVEAALAEGSIAGFAAAGRPERSAGSLRARDRGRRFAEQLAEAFKPRPELRALVNEGTLICRCEDVRFGVLRGEWTGRQAKLYTRIGMGPCQGRVCGPAAEVHFGWDLESGRTPVTVATIDALARAGDDDERHQPRSRHG